MHSMRETMSLNNMGKVAFVCKAVGLKNKQYENADMQTEASHDMTILHFINIITACAFRTVRT